MRHNQNGRRFRGRNNGQGHQNGGHNPHNGNNNGHNRRINPRMQTFDSNGPDVRIRGNAYQINEKYAALARDAASAGDRVLAESYLQHAEYYQRLINEMTEEYNRNNPQPYQPQTPQPITGEEPQPDVVLETAGGEEQDGLSDLDQSFLVGNRRAPQNGVAEVAVETVGEAAAVEERPSRRVHARGRETETV